MTKTASMYFQLKNLTPQMRKAVKVASALEGLNMQEWIVKVIEKEVKRMGIQIEGGD